MCISPVALFLGRTLTNIDSWSPPTSSYHLLPPWMLIEHPQLILVPLSLTMHLWEFGLRLLCYELTSEVTQLFWLPGLESSAPGFPQGGGLTVNWKQRFNPGCTIYQLRSLEQIYVSLILSFLLYKSRVIIREPNSQGC